METKFERHDPAAGASEPFTPAKVHLQDAWCWPGIHVEEWEGNDDDLPETVLLQGHGIAVNLTRPVRSEVRWAGHRPIDRVYAPGMLGIFPERIPYRATSRGGFRGLILGIFPERIPYRATSRGGFRGLILGIESAHLRSVGESFGLHDGVALKPEFCISDAYLLHAIRLLADDVRAGYPQGTMFGEAIGAGLLAHLIRRHSTRVVALASVAAHGQRERERIREYVGDNLHEELKLVALARHMEMDVYAFSRWFRRAFGVPPHRYVLEQRVQRAQALLRAGRGPLTEIALQCGFYSASHFSTVFRRLVGVTPTAYRSA